MTHGDCQSFTHTPNTHMSNTHTLNTSINLVYKYENGDSQSIKERVQSKLLIEQGHDHLQLQPQRPA